MLEINLHFLEGTLTLYVVVGIFLYFLSVIKQVHYTQFITRNKFLKMWVACIILAILQVICAIGIELIRSNESMQGWLYTILIASIFAFGIASRTLFLIIIIKRAVRFTYKKLILFAFCISLLLNEILDIIPFLFVVVFSILWLLIPINIPEEFRGESI